MAEEEDDGEDSDALDGRAARAERRRTERRSAILGAAKAVFRDKGYHQASVHDIIDQARIARGTFYLYFSSKQEVFGELIDDFLRVTRAQVRNISLDEGADPPLEQLRANFRRVVATVLENDDVASVILRDPTSFDVESRTRVNHFFDQVLTVIEDAMQVGQKIGVVGDCDIHIAAVTALGGLCKALERLLAAHTGDPTEKARERAFHDPAHLADELLTFFIGGLQGARD